MRIDELFISEKRRNADLNTKMLPMDQLRQYAGQKDVFVSYTQDVGSASHFPGTAGHDSRHEAGVRSSGRVHNTRGAKLGINPQSKYETPIGIYAYPVDYVLLKDGDVEFAGNSPYMHVFRAEGNFLDIAEYSKDDLDRDLEKLEKMNMRRSVIRDGISGADPPTPAGKIWNVTRLLATDITDRLNDSHYEEVGDDIEPEEDEFDSYEEYEEALLQWEEDRPDRDYRQKNIAKVPVQWNLLLRQLGYDGSVDFKGKGVLHENEPVQAVFFTKKVTTVLDVIYNRTQREEYTLSQIISNRPDLLGKMFAKGRITLEQAIELLKDNPYLMREIGYENLAKPIQDYMVQHYEEFVHKHNNDFLKFVPLPASVVIAILQKEPFRANDIKLSPTVQKYILANFDKFSKYMGGLKLPTAKLIEKLRADPELIGLLPKDPTKLSPQMMNAIIDIKPDEFVPFVQSYSYPMDVPPVVAQKFMKYILKSPYKSQWMTLLRKSASMSLNANAVKQFAAYMAILPPKLQIEAYNAFNTKHIQATPDMRSILRVLDKYKPK